MTDTVVGAMGAGAIMSASGAAPRLPIGAGRPGSLQSSVSYLDGLDDRPVAWFRGEVTSLDAPLVADVVRSGVKAGVPIVGIIQRMGLTSDAAVGANVVDSRDSSLASNPTPADGLSALAGWGSVTRALTEASGVVPTAVILDGPCLGGPALAVGLVDVVLMTRRAALFINGPEASMRMTGGEGIDPAQLGGSGAHLTLSGIADTATYDVDDAIASLGDVLSFLPPNNLSAPPVAMPTDPAERSSIAAAALVPTDGHASYDVREVICDLVDHGWFVELRPGHGRSLVIGLARIAGLPVGIVASQPSQLAGALDIDSSAKGARFVRWCDAFNLPLVTLIDTPGFRPGRDQEWRGIVRHGAKLAFAYAEATVPRVSVVLRKAYGGAYIVMDCKAMGNDCALAWPGAEIAVMGARSAVEILHRRRLGYMPATERAVERTRLEQAYAAEHLSPRAAADRGYIDEVIDPARTRRTLAEALTALIAKRESPTHRGHENIPL